MPQLVPQDRNSGLRFAGQYYNEAYRFILKSAHMSRDDQRVFDAKSGRLIYNSHHPGSNRMCLSAAATAAAGSPILRYGSSLTLPYM